MSLVLTWGARIPVVRIARMAGQYAKPRSSPTEIVDGDEVISFRGDNINGFDPKDRKPDPGRLLQYVIWTFEWKKQTFLFLSILYVYAQFAVILGPIFIQLQL
jgi:hypothetical protein